jgi:murein L,D-transpeptidase YafK
MQKMLLFLSFSLFLTGCVTSQSNSFLSTKSESEITHLHVDKSQRKLRVFSNKKVLKEIPIQLGFNPNGDKIMQGDGRTPEGIYRIDRKNPKSQFYLSLGISYPNQKDIQEARKRGVNPGGDIFIHGQPNEYPKGKIKPGDWTAGCVAVADSIMRVLFEKVKIGTPIVITQ